MIDTLTEREQEILVCMAEGLSNQAIGQRLHLAGNTVRWYNSQIYSKLGVSNRDEAIQQAQSLGLLPVKSDTPPSEAKHNLYYATTDFVGRNNEIIELQDLVAAKRLITILAPGGMGKTRLSLEVARTQIGRFADGVYFVRLESLRSTNDIVTTIAENIGFIFYGQNPPQQQLVTFLKDRMMLLVLDNFEHLLTGADLVSDIIRVTSTIKIIVTSRERLNLHGETVYSLHGLEFPQWETPADAMAYDAVKLFMQSAHRVRSDFALQAGDLKFLARICRLTAGMPLGIELAAGWVDILSLEQIANEIQQGIEILETEMRDVPERHRSLRATFDWTWERLTEKEQAVFMRLPVFRGGFTVKAAEDIAGADVRTLRQLANKALLQIAPDYRHSIHELLRQFGAKKLAESGEQADTQAKHAAFFAHFMAERTQDIGCERQIEALKLIDSDYENVRLAWQYMVSHQQWELMPNFLPSLWFYLDPGSRAREALELLEPAVKGLRSMLRTAVTELALGCVLARLSWFIRDVGSFETSAAIGEEALDILRQHDSYDDLLWALYNRILLAWFQGYTELIEELAQEGLAISRLIGDGNWEGSFLTLLATAYIYTDMESALQLAEKGVAMLETFEDHHKLLHGMIIMSLIKELQQDYEQATYWIGRWRLEAQAIGNIFIYAHSYVDEGKIFLAQQDYAEAWVRLRKGLQLYWDEGYTWFVAYPLVYMVRWFAGQHELDRGVELLAAMDKHLIGFQHVDQVAHALYDQLTTGMEPGHFAAAWARGEKQDLGAFINRLLA